MQQAEKGFTIIEVLAVIMVFIVIGSIAAATFFTSLRTINKTNSLASLRENGNFAVNQVVKMLRFATAFEGVSSDGTPGSFSAKCYEAPVKDAEYSFLRFKSYDGGYTTLSCTSGKDGNIASNSASLLDSGIVKWVDKCSFACSQAYQSDNPTVTVSLTISEQATVSGIVERTTTIPFKTSVTLRNPVLE